MGETGGVWFLMEVGLWASSRIVSWPNYKLPIAGPCGFWAFSLRVDFSSEGSFQSEIAFLRIISFPFIPFILVWNMVILKTLSQSNILRTQR